MTALIVAGGILAAVIVTVLFAALRVGGRARDHGDAMAEQDAYRGWLL